MGICRRKLPSRFVDLGLSESVFPEPFAPVNRLRFLPLFVLATIVLPSMLRAQIGFDVQHYTVKLRVPSLNAPGQIFGSTEIDVLGTQANVTQLDLSLSSTLTVDSVHVNGALTPNFTFTAGTLAIQLPAPIGQGGQASTEVFYHGTPGADPQGFGGWAFNGNFAYNLGVSINLFPHGFGRAWYPCVDNFTDKATYSYQITVDTSKAAVCGGILTNTVQNGNGTATWNWEQTDPIPTYLASCAISNYIAYTDTFNSISGGQIPVSIYVRPFQAAAVVGSFQNLEECFNAFEARFGPFRWQRVGYVTVPFTGGAMEHANNIAYPELVVGGTTTYDWLMAHELSHNWFGNLVTCETAEDMWLNEGFARYAEALFYEDVQSPTAGRNYLRDLHDEVIRTAHVTDGGHWPVSPIPVPAHTYGATVYDKGATIAHSLRHYLGNSIFNQSLTDYFDQYAFDVHSSEDFRQRLETLTGENLLPFFEGWVYQPGFAHFSLDSFRVENVGGSFETTVHIRQRLRNKANLVNNNRIPVRLVAANHQFMDGVVEFSGAIGSATFTTAFNPATVMVDPMEQYCDATVDELFKVNSVQLIDESTQKYIQLNLTTLTDSAWVQVTHNWIGADYTPGTPAGIRLNNNHYWTLSGVGATNGNLTFRYNGNVANNGPDSTWITQTEDSLVVLWRPEGGAAWMEMANVTRTPGNLTDKVGTITLNSFIANGDYALGIYESTFVGADEPGQQLASALQLQLFPNPAQNVLNVRFTQPGVTQVEMLDMAGRSLGQWPVAAGETGIQLDLSQFSNGLYLIRAQTQSGRTAQNRLVIQH